MGAIQARISKSSGISAVDGGPFGLPEGAFPPFRRSDCWAKLEASPQEPGVLNGACRSSSASDGAVLC